MSMSPESDSHTVNADDALMRSVDQPIPPEVEVTDASGHTEVHLTGDWQMHGVAQVDNKVRKIGVDLKNAEVVVHFDNVGRLDTSGALLVERMKDRLELAGCTISYKGATKDQSTLLDAVGNALRVKHEDEEGGPPPGLAERFFAPVGQLTMSFYEDFIAAMFILGSAVRGTQLKRDRSSGISPAAIVNQMDHMGVRAVPIITLMSFLIGGIIAQQGAFQLRYFGAEIFVVDLVGILQLREIGVLLTAIMIAGRSGSAITAEIGSMKMREEVDALKVMGLNPVGVLVFPRLVALTIMLPALTIVANFAALTGACVTTWVYSGITPDTFMTRLREAIDMSTIISGMIKAPFMALIIGIVASVEGLKVGGSAESLGRHVTAAVVKAIFVVILVDGLFAIFYGAIDF